MWEALGRLGGEALGAIAHVQFYLLSFDLF